MEETKKPGIRGSTLKIIAIITMLIDHIGCVLFDNGYFMQFTNDTIPKSDPLFWLDVVLRLIGRNAFPIFTFLIVEGYIHTRDIKKYLLRLLGFALISEIPFDIANAREIFYLGYNNVYFTLAIGLTSLILWDTVIDGSSDRTCSPLKRFLFAPIKNKIIAVVGVAALSVIAEALRTDYGMFGVLLIFVMYLFKDVEPMKYASASAILLLNSFMEIVGIFAFIPISKYNGERGLNLKYVFYIFYPAHLLILALIRYLVLGIGISL